MTDIVFSIPGEPVPFARAGANGKQRFTPARQSSFMTAVRLFAQKAMADNHPEPIEGPVSLTVHAAFLIPQSWSKSKRAAVVWKESKPDLDNIVKIIKDACNKIVWHDDAQVAELHASKVYGANAAISISVSTLIEHSSGFA